MEQSVADGTEVLWFDRRRQRVAWQAPQAVTGSRRQRTVEVRAVADGRLGQYRIGGVDWGELASALRVALAQARVSSILAPPLLPPTEAAGRLPILDRRLARLGEEEAIQLLSRRCREDESAILEWNDGRVLLHNSEGLHLSQRATSVHVQVRSGRGAAAGFASDAARHLDDVGLDAVFERARARRATGGSDEPGDRPVPLVLAPEAAAELVEALNQRAFSARAYCNGTSFLREHLGVQVFDQSFGLRDDGLDRSGLPFPFDLEGRLKAPVVLVDAGVPRTPTLDAVSARSCGLSPTGHAVCAGEAYGLNLFMEEGTSSEAELLAEADGGLWISRLEAVECFDPSRMLIRARARGVRRIEKGALARQVPELIWEDSLLRIFSGIGGLGRNRARRLSADGVLGGICAPAVLLRASGSLTAAAPTPD